MVMSKACLCWLGSQANMITRIQKSNHVRVIKGSAIWYICMKFNIDDLIFTAAGEIEKA